MALNKLVMVMIFNDADIMAGEHKRNMVSYVFQEKKSSENCTVIDYAVDGDFARIMKSEISCSQYKNIL